MYGDTYSPFYYTLLNKISVLLVYYLCIISVLSEKQWMNH